MFMFSWLKNTETQYDDIEKKTLTVIQCLAEVWQLVTESKYFIKLYINYFALKSNFSQVSDANKKITY